MKNLVVILGTAREGNESQRVFNEVCSLAKKYADVVTSIDVKEWGITHTGEASKADKTIRPIIQSAEAYVIITPEYNRGYPGELKLFLDSFYLEYVAKPVGFVGVSSGSTGGARAVEQLKLSALGMNLIPIRTHLYVPFSESFSGGEDFKQDASNFFKELNIYSTHLHDLQQHLKKVI